MRALKLLYQIDSRDNVATALGNLDEGEKIEVVDAAGETKLELQVLSHVPQFFKVAIIQLSEGQPIVKWGQDIGNVASVSNRTREQYPTIDLTVEPGTVVHIANFIPLPAITKHWGPHPIPFAASAIAKLGSKGPFEIGHTRKSRHLEEGSPIYTSDFDFDEYGQHKLADTLLPEPGAGVPFGIALSDIDAGAPLHLGVMVASRDHLYPGERAQVETVRSFYTFLKGRLYELS